MLLTSAASCASSRSTAQLSGGCHGAVLVGEDSLGAVGGGCAGRGLLITVSRTLPVEEEFKMSGSGRFLLVVLVGLVANGLVNCVDPFIEGSTQWPNGSLGGMSSVGLVAFDLPSPLAILGRLGTVFATTPARLSMSVSRRISSSDPRVCACEPGFLGTNRGNLVREGRELLGDRVSGGDLLLPGGKLGRGGGVSSRLGV